jgi:hypothetical protein
MSFRELLDASRTNADSDAPPSSCFRFLLASIAGAEREFWLLAVTAMVGDVLLTLYGLGQGLVETNPIARSAIESAGAVGLYGLKLAAVGVGVVCLPLLPTQYRVIVPLGLAIPSLCAAVINALLIGSILL